MCHKSFAARLLLILAAVAPFALPAGGPARVFSTQVAEGVRLVTAVSSTTPFLGEQISIVYRIQTGVAIAALDVDPQNFDGFWSVVVPVSEPGPAGGRSDMRSQELILRQVVVWPLRVGTLGLPPLRVKLRLSGQRRGDGSWDLIAESEPPAIVVRAVPQAPAQSLPLVGKVTAALQAPVDGGGMVLELAGTANLSFFEPVHWLRSGSLASPRVALLDSDQVPQRQFKDGALDLTLLQRRRWRLLRAGGSALPGTLPDIRFFDPADESWKTVTVPGARGGGQPRESAPSGAEVAAGRPPSGLRPVGAVVVLVVVVAAAAVLAARVRRRR